MRSNHTIKQNPTSQRGVALLAALCFSLVLAIALGSYITVCYRSLEMSTRNMNGSHSIELAETGMEEALWSLNNSNWTGWNVAGTTATKELTGATGFTYDNGASGSITLKVENYTGTTGTRTVTVTGTTTLGDGTTTKRTLTATCSPATLFPNAVAATTGTVTFSSGGTVDSYDSTLGTYASQTPTYSAVVSSNKTPATAASVTITNVQIQGSVASFYSGGPSYSTSAKLRSSSAAVPVAYQGTNPINSSVDIRQISNSPYQPVFDIRTISGGTTLLAPATNSTVTLGSPSSTTFDVYRYSSLDLTGTTKIKIDGKVRLVIAGNFYVGLHGGTPSIEVTTNGTLEVFTGSDIAIYGNGMNNLTKDPSRMAVYGTNALSPPDMNTTVDYYGVIYTPTGNFTVASNNAIYGAIVAKQLSFSGSAPKIHYDKNLSAVVFPGIDTPFAVANWREIANP